MPDVSLAKQIEVKDAMLKHARIIAKSRDPQIRIAASQEEMRLQRELDQLIAERDAQPPLPALAALGAH